MKAKIDFNGTLEEFRTFTKSYKGSCAVEAVLSVVTDKAPLYLEDQAEEAARPFMPDNKIQAIKAVIAITGWDLITAKNFVEGKRFFP